MMDSRAVYTSAAWIKCRTGYMQSQHYVCERCGGIGEICHHKTYITPENIHDPYITLNWDNLECVCQHCHNAEHHTSPITRDGLQFDEEGNLQKMQSPHL